MKLLFSYHCRYIGLNC